MSVRSVVHLGWPLIILCSVTIHAVIGACMVYDDANGELLLLAGLSSLRTHLGLSVDTFGWLLLVLGFMAASGIWIEGKTRRWLIGAVLVTPQYLVMLYSLYEEVRYVFAPHLYMAPNPRAGQSIDPSLILVVLAFPICVAAFHTLGYIERYVLRWTRWAWVGRLGG